MHDHPERIGPYTIERRLGPHTWVGRGPDGRAVAVKLHRPAPDQVRRHQREISALRKIDHPGIVRVVDDGREGDALFLVTAFHQAHDLEGLLLSRGETGWPRGEAATLIERLAAALSRCHRSGLAHRDLKPANVLVRPGLDPLVVDVGLARQDEHDALADQRALAQIAAALVADHPPALRKALSESPADRFRDVETFARALCAELRAAPRPMALPPVRHTPGATRRALLALSCAGLTLGTVASLAVGPGPKRLPKPAPPVVAASAAPPAFIDVVGRHRLRLEMVRVPGQTFRMGADQRPGARGFSSEHPVRSVTLRPFYIARFETTQALFQEVMGFNPSLFKSPVLPVDSVIWEEAREFCQRLAKLTGRMYRLPGEAEWEAACRAGNSAPHYWGERTEDYPKYAWCVENAGGRSHPVGLLQPNALGLHDMLGNVWEWTADVHEPGSDEVKHVVRGGGWELATAAHCRSSVRFSPLVVQAAADVGFRVVSSPSR